MWIMTSAHLNKRKQAEIAPGAMQKSKTVGWLSERVGGVHHDPSEVHEEGARFDTIYQPRLHTPHEDAHFTRYARENTGFSKLVGCALQYRLLGGGECSGQLVFFFFNEIQLDGKRREAWVQHNTTRVRQARGERPEEDDQHGQQRDCSYCRVKSIIGWLGTRLEFQYARTHGFDDGARSTKRVPTFTKKRLPDGFGQNRSILERRPCVIMERTCIRRLFVQTPSKPFACVLGVSTHSTCHSRRWSVAHEQVGRPAASSSQDPSWRHGVARTISDDVVTVVCYVLLVLLPIISLFVVCP